MQLILYMMFAIRCFLTNACNCTTLDAAKVDSTFFLSTCCIFLRIQIAEYDLFLCCCFFFTRNFFGWEIFSDLHCQKIGSSCFDIILKMWRQTRLVIIAAILVGFFSICEICDKYTVIRKHDNCLGWKPRCHDLSSTL